MDPKPRPNNLRYLEALRAMTPDQRLQKAFELGELGRQLFADGLRRRHPELSEAEFRRILLSHLSRWHSGTY
jgi:hypothetical protein